MNYFLQRFKEPSTWAGLGILATLFNVPALHIEVVTQAGIALASALAVFIPESK